MLAFPNLIKRIRFHWLPAVATNGVDKRITPFRWKSSMHKEDERLVDFKRNGNKYFVNSEEDLLNATVTKVRTKDN